MKRIDMTAFASTKQHKNARLNLRVSSRQDVLVRQAAAAVGKNVTEFVLDSACVMAEHVLADRRRFVLDDVAWDRFLEALDRPVRTKPRLKALLEEPSILDRP
jgi:uncharacterized protein (DUF1778 family)